MSIETKGSESPAALDLREVKCVRTPRHPVAWAFLVVLVTLGVSQAAGPPPLPRLDHYGDPLPPHAVARLGTTRLRYPCYGATHLAFSRDGKILASSGHGGIRSWRVSDGKLTRPIQKLLFVTRGEDNLLALRLTEDANFLHDVSTRKDVRRLPKSAGDFRYLFGSMFISPNGKVGAVPRYGDRADVGLLDLSTGKGSAFLKGKFLMTAVAFSRDGKTLWTGDTPEDEGEGRGRIRVWDIATKKSIRDLPAGRGVIYALALSDDGKTLAVAQTIMTHCNDADDETAVTLRDTATGKELRVLSRHATWPSSLAFTPDGRTVAVGRSGNLEHAGAIELYDVKTGKELFLAPSHRTSVVATSFRPSVREIVTVGQDRTVRVWSDKGKPLAVTDLVARRPPAVAIDSGGTRVAWAEQDGKVFVRDLTTGKEIGPLGVREPKAPRLTFRPDGKALAVSGGSGVRLWDFGKSKATEIAASGGKRSCYAFSADGSRFAMAHDEERFTLHDSATGKQILSFEKPFGPIGTLVFSRDGRTLAACSFQTISLWDVATGKKRGVSVSHPASIDGSGYDCANQIAFSPDGTLLASGGVGEDFTVRLWDVATGKERARLEGHAMGISSLAFSPDGKRLVSGSEDSTALVWDVPDALAGRGP